VTSRDAAASNMWGIILEITPDRSGRSAGD
jgi:hypothetical protein